MMMNRLSQSLRTLLAGAICLSILCGVLVLHAWPLWTGQSVLLPVTPIDPRDLFRGEYVRLDTPATRLMVRSEGQTSGALTVRPIGTWWSELPTDPYDRRQASFGRVVYVQLEPRGESGEWQPVSISIEPVADRTNLRGRIDGYDVDIGDMVKIDYGLDSFYMQEGTAKPVEDALRMRRRVQMEVAVTSSGYARIRRLLVDGVAVGR